VVVVVVVVVVVREEGGIEGEGREATSFLVCILITSFCRKLPGIRDTQATVRFQRPNSSSCTAIGGRRFAQFLPLYVGERGKMECRPGCVGRRGRGETRQG